MAKKKSSQNILVWVLMGLLILGLAGFGIDGFLGQRVRAIGSVGGQEITVDQYARSLQQQMRGIEGQTGQAMSFAQMQAMGLDQRVRAQLVTQAALDAEAERIGLSLGDENVSRALAEIGAFRGPSGEFDRDSYRFALQNVGMTPREFEDELRRETARGILQAATAGAVDTPANLRSALLDHYATRHSLAIFRLTEAMLDTPVEDPTAAEIEAFYDANTERFMAPEIRHVTYAWITPPTLFDTIDVEEEALRTLYDSGLAEFVQPERRLVERLVYPDEDAATDAFARLQEGEVEFEDLVAERGLDLDDTDMGDVARADLGAAGDPVFALTEPGQVTGPHQTSVGPALFRMNAILSAQEVTFEEARPDLEDELAADRARRIIADDYDIYEDLLAGGATLEDLSQETALELGTIDWFEDNSEGIAAYAEFRAAVRAADEDDFPAMVTLSDGGLFALRLDGITAPAPRPLAEVRDEALQGARAERVAAQLMTQAEDMQSALANQGVDAFAEASGLEPDRIAQITRLDRLPDLPDELIETLFAAEPGAPVIAAQGDTVLLAMLTDRQPPDLQDPQTDRLIASIDSQIGAALAQDVFSYFAHALEREAGISLNQAAIEAVHANFR
ncbi:SurA N-terminal domain-containing protein [Pararhodobacter sp. SW119]|uniref:SurA N-terminal domain-containing protein n=1 Tax=Pararhodobacter sp. SW119 TaxID=2780075 RepID=UPI001AE00532|nr:SurA N-terminal domain-containing protein [Pararhodobacter sp. SW119]